MGKKRGAGRPPIPIPAGVRQRLGKEPDTVIARDCDVSRDTVKAWRKRLGKDLTWRGDLRGIDRDNMKMSLAVLNRTTTLTMTEAAKDLKISVGVAKQLSEEGELVWQGRRRKSRTKTVLRARAVRAMVDLGGMSMAEAAEVIGVVPQAVGRHLREGRLLARSRKKATG